MSDYLLPTLVTFASMLVLAVGFAGVGLGVRRLFGVKSMSVDAVFLAFWTGFGVITLFLMLWNFLLPVDGLALGAVLVVGALGLGAAGRDLVRSPPGEWTPSWRGIGLALLAGLWIANLSTGPFDSWDGGLYHLQAVKWAGAYPVVPGIGNLHGPLAFNNGSFLYAAMLDSGPWIGRAFHLANGLLMLVMMWQVGFAAARILNSKAEIESRDVYQLALLAPLLDLAMGGSLTDFNTDLPATILLLASGVVLLDLLCRRDREPLQRDYSIVALAILLSTVGCLKISVGAFSVFAAPVVVYAWWQQGDGERGRSLRPALWASLLILLFAVVWTGRGIIMSGYPLFPTPVLGFPVDWKVPDEHALAEMANIRFTELEFEWELGRRWLSGVLWETPYSVFFPLGMALSAAGVLLCSLLFEGSARRLRHESGAWWVLLPAGAAIVAWFVVAPSPRYATALFWTLAALLVSRVFIFFRSELATHRRPLVAAAVLIGLLPLGTAVVRRARRHDGSYLSAVSGLYVAPGPDHGFHPINPNPDISRFVTASGLVVNTPDRATPGMEMVKCWDLPLPCTPNPAANLQLRAAGGMDRGFRVEGPWDMEDFPYYWRGSFLDEWRARR